MNLTQAFAQTSRMLHGSIRTYAVFSGDTRLQEHHNGKLVDPLVSVLKPDKRILISDRTLNETSLVYQVKLIENEDGSLAAFVDATRKWALQKLDARGNLIGDKIACRVVPPISDNQQLTGWTVLLEV